MALNASSLDTNSSLNWLERLPVRFSVMDRYILTELLMPFLFGVVAFSSIGVAIGVLFDLVRRITERGLPLTIALQVFALKLPYFVSLAFPMSILLACLMVYGRLSSDSELIALRSCGVSVYRLVAPAIAIGLVITGITFVFNEAVVPSANYQAARLLEQTINSDSPTYRDKDIVYQEFNEQKLSNGAVSRSLARIFYAQEFDGRQMKGLTVLDFSQTGINQIIKAESATWDADEKVWNFANGTIYVISSTGSYQNILRFERQRLELPRAPLDIAQSIRNPDEMTIVEMRDYLGILEQMRDQRQIRRFTLRIDQKVAFPFACLMFGLVGSTLGIRPQRSGRATGFGKSLILILSYYLLTSICEGLYYSLYQYGFFPSFLAAWLPTLLGLGMGVLLLVRLNR
jgi:lipopolysaccharide export system permease protein